VERREFAAGLGAWLTGLGLGPDALARVCDSGGRRSGAIRFGYAAITWGGDDPQAIEDIASLGFRGIQLRTAAVNRWGERPGELKDLLAARRLTLVALSSGDLRLDPAKEKRDREQHVRHARFVREVGGLYLQVLDQHPGRSATPDDFRRLGRLLTELGRRTADLGVPLGYHNHMGSLGQTPDQVARILDAADPEFVKFELDTAHYRQGGGDPADAVRRYAERLLFLHVKDVVSPVPGQGPESYRFVELGRGKVDLRAVFSALDAVGFDDWAVIELDESDRPKESALISRTYLTEVLGRQV